jgi:hypothetical protein
MPKVRGNPAEKWVRKASASTQDYTDGVDNPRVPWATAAAAAAANQAAGVQAAIARQAYAKGVQKAGNDKWQRKASGVGASRFSQGVQAGQSDYQSGVAPYLQVIESTTLPPRGPKGDPKNLQRVAAIATALRNKKVSGS